MPALIVVALVVAVIWAAGRAPAGGATPVDLGPAPFQVPGGGLSGPISPVMQNGSRFNNSENNLKLWIGTPVPPMTGIRQPTWRGVPVGSSTHADAVNAMVRGSLVPPPLAPLPSATVFPDTRMLQNKV